MYTTTLLIQDEKRQEFENLTKPLIKFLNDFHPHVKIVIDTNSAEMVEGVTIYVTNEFIKD